MGRVTIVDVAAAAGVSVSTVSKVINGRDGIAGSTRLRVQQAVSELGFERSLVARSLRTRRTHVIGILVAGFEPFSAEILKGAATALTDTDYELLAYTAASRGGGAGWERRYLSRLGALIGGAVLVTPSVVDADAGVPLVTIDPHTGPVDLPSVSSDNLTGAMLATRHLIELGHRRIGFLAGRPDLESSRAREAGFRQAMADGGLEVDPDLVRVGDYRREAARAPATELLSHRSRPTAVFAANDLSAMGTMDVARELGLTVPTDLSVVGFDDIPEAAVTTPGLTTVHQPIQQLAATAIGLLVDLMDEMAPEQTHVQLPVSLVRRGSTARALESRS
ncbi:LacI family DNA-binding transcriptional regulator [Angustibacter sp. McL0619]|uniref:LacI family DNA-binding transcriptional regulator n=1 Tax=Angustibacter sp. McL0619 TaxID=3415676 RepID=UPI003CF14EF9